MSSAHSRVVAALASSLFTLAAAPATAATSHTVHPAAVTRNSVHTTSSKAFASATYSNWTGYQMRASKPSGARATWKVPAVTWQGRNGYSNQWVGIGGGNGPQGQLIQAGTESDSVCVAVSKGHCTKSRATYFLWFETYPQRAQERITNLAVAPGDTVDVQVSYQQSTSNALFTMCNVSRKSCVTATRKTSAPRSVAEFVVERPSDAAGHQLALAKFGRSDFSNMRVTDSGRTLKAGSLPATRITMSTNHPLATAEGLSKDGDQVSTTFLRPL